MGMELLLVRLTPAQQEAIAADPELLDLVFPEDEQAPLPGALASLDIDADTLMESYPGHLGDPGRVGRRIRVDAQGRERHRHDHQVRLRV
jgi:hypothetical protein